MSISWPINGLQDGGTCLHPAREARLSKILEPFFLCVDFWGDRKPELGSVAQLASAKHLTIEDIMIISGLRIGVKISFLVIKTEKKELTLYVCRRHLFSDDSHWGKRCYKRELVYSAFLRLISIVETARVPPPSWGKSSVPMTIPLMLSCFMNRRLVISATSTAVVIERPLAFRVTISAVGELKLVMTART